MQFKQQLSDGEIWQIKKLIDKEAAKKLMAYHSFEEIRSSYDQGDAIAAIKNSHVIGHISLVRWRECVEIVALIVCEAYRRKGIGSALFSKITKLANKKYPNKRVIVLTNQVSRQIGLQCGFVLEDKHQIDDDVWNLCEGCEEFSSFPNCHCEPMVFPKLEIVQIKASDLDLIKGIAGSYCKVWREHPWCEDFWTVQGVTKDVLQHLEKTKPIVLAAISRGAVIGFAWGSALGKAGLGKVSSGADLEHIFNGHKEIFYVDELGVSKKQREKGVGLFLMQSLIEKAKQEGIQNFCLRTDEKAVAARKLYKKMGFCHLGVRDGKHASRTYWLL